MSRHLARVLFVFLLFFTACSESSANEPSMPPTSPAQAPSAAAPSDTVASTQVTTTTAEEAPPPTTVAESADPLEASTSCTELFAAAAPVLQAALAVLDEAFGGRSERQVLDLPSADLDDVFDRMAEVEGYEIFTDRRRGLGCTSSAQIAGCVDRQSEVDATDLNPMLSAQWLRSLGCEVSTEEGQ